MELTPLAGIAAAALYLISSVLVLLPVRRGERIERKSRVLLPAVAGAVVHLALAMHGIVAVDALNLDFMNALTLTAWLMVTLWLTLAFRRPVESLGIAVLPVAAATVLTGSFHNGAGAGTQLELQTHVFFSVSAYGMLALSALQAAVLSIQSRQLHNHKPGGFIRALPPLSTMEQLLFSMISAGFVLLTLALLSGFMFLEDMFAQHVVHKTVLSIAAWILFGILLYGRARYGWRGKRAVKWTISAFVLLLLAYFGSKFVMEFLIGNPPAG
ncbi:cytochrome c biogenesis protein CcsA [Granulosicoccaceae sp. 1_MG-2023]|nr:cytochrome c biogenesis protein CcsA [Granulosicoccaceae sp. 1_MG-2023]